MLSAKRQQEIGHLMKVLKQFHPTKIAVEANIVSKKVRPEYTDYLVGKCNLARDKSDQIGFRLAKNLGHRTIYPVDEEAEFPIQRVMNYAKVNRRAAKFEQVASAGARWRERKAFPAHPFGTADDGIHQKLAKPNREVISDFCRSQPRCPDP